MKDGMAAGVCSNNYAPFGYRSGAGGERNLICSQQGS
jgi:hypothetical protein